MRVNKFAAIVPATLSVLLLAACNPPMADTM